VKLKTVLNTIAYSVLVKGDIIFVGVGWLIADKSSLSPLIIQFTFIFFVNKKC
jgi:hypothetical protein